ncbi:MAG: single-stranded DNA-binding protein [Candidatus Zixiibacteriota bacterium]
MNKFVGKGRIVKNAVVSGVKNKALSFTVATKVGYDDEIKKDRYAFVPCVLFNPKEETVEELTEDGAGLEVEFAGFVRASSYKKGEDTKWQTEVVINPETFNIIEAEE